MEKFKLYLLVCITICAMFSLYRIEQMSQTLEKIDTRVFSLVLK